MTDRPQELKKDAGKPRMELIPWDSVQTTSEYYAVPLVVHTLVYWWTRQGQNFLMRIPEQVLPGVAKVLAFGAAKYAERAWEKGIPFSRVYAAAMRHANTMARGELLDDETQLPHEWHFWCNVIFLVTFTARGRTDLDDRPPAQQNVAQRIVVTKGSSESN